MHTCSFALTTVSITWPRFYDRFLFGSHHFAPCKGIQDRFWILRCGFQVDLLTSRAFEREARSYEGRARSASERKFVLGPTTPDQKTMRTTLRKSRFQVAGLYTGFQCLSVEIEIWIPIVSGIPDSVELYSRFHTQKFPAFRIPHTKISGISDSTRKKFPDSFTWGESFKKSEKFTFRNFLSPAVRELYVCQLCKPLMTAHEWKFHSYLNADKLIAKSNNISDTDSCVFGLCFDWVLEVRLPTCHKWWG